MAAPVAAFSGTPLSGSAPLPVVFTDESTGMGDPWNVPFDLGPFSDRGCGAGCPGTSWDETPTYEAPLGGVGVYPVIEWAITVTVVDSSYVGVLRLYATGSTFSFYPNLDALHVVGPQSGSGTRNCKDGVTTDWHDWSLSKGGDGHSYHIHAAADWSDLFHATGTLRWYRVADDSQGTIASWAWDFGDGETSTEQNPTHVYTDPGVYTVALTATNADGSDVETKVAYVHVYVGAMEWDVYQINPPGDSITYLATLDDAFDKTIKIERNNTGSGQFTISRYSEHATAAILAPGNLIKVRITAIDTDYLFSFFLETGDFILVSSDEEGGENITFGGRGGLAYWDNAVWLQESYVIPWWDPAWGTPPAGTIGRLIVAPGTTFWDYTITAGRVASRTKVTSSGGFAAWYDSRKSYRWISTSPYYPKTAKLVQLSSGGMDNHWLHPMDAGFTEIRATYVTGQKAEFAEIGDGTKPGQILERIYQEGMSADRPSHPLPLLTIDFDDTLDSTPEAWASTDALLGITAEVGEHYLSTVMKLIETGIIDVEMDPDLGFHAWNSRGRDLTGNAFGAGVVRFVKGVNIAADLHRERTDGPVATFTQVVGNDASAQAELADAATRVTRETSTRGDTDDATALAALGLADLEGRLVRSDAIGFAIATGDVDATGLYLPGPPGSDHGDFWVGDFVTLHTGTGEQDFNNTAERVAAITISEDEADNLDVVVELGSGLGANETALGSGTSSPGPGSDGSGGGSGGGGTFDGSLYQELSERGVADGYAALDGAGLVPIAQLASGTPDGTKFVRDDGTLVTPTGAAPTTADYLVGTAQAGLSAEIVVGTTPGGELGGTWASPTVDGSHSGSTHLALGSTSSTAAAGDHAHAGGGIGPLLLASDHSAPIIFDDILQASDGSDFLYASEA